MPARVVLGLACAGVLAPAVGWQVEPPAPPGYMWDLPRGFPRPRIPAGNPMSQAKVELGRYLFYDKRLSVNGTQSCASCHRQELAFTDGRAKALGATGQEHPRSALSLVNVAYAGVLTWSNPNLRSLEEQALIPMLSDHPVELGLRGRVNSLLRQLAADPVYREMFPKAFPGTGSPFSLDHIAKALAAFERTIVSARSPYDRFYSGGDAGAISESAQRGQALFFTDGVAGCFRCHSGFNFSDASVYEGSGNAPIAFHNTALYNMPLAFRYPWPNLGIYTQTRRLADVGKFRTPSLRNVELTAPYMHDGSVATLEEVLDHYAAGGRTIKSGPFAGRGHENPDRDARMTGIALTAQNRKDLLAFLRSLTDSELTRDPRFSDPWKGRLTRPEAP
jgi:cytochrome c peroxidase